MHAGDRNLQKCLIGFISEGISVCHIYILYLHHSQLLFG